MFRGSALRSDEWQPARRLPSIGRGGPTKWTLPSSLLVGFLRDCVRGAYANWKIRQLPRRGFKTFKSYTKLESSGKHPCVPHVQLESASGHQSSSRVDFRGPLRPCAESAARLP